MILRALHSTTYSYSESVSLCHSEVRLKPRVGSNQRLLQHQLVVFPEPSSLTIRQDYFGNDVSALTIDKPHTNLSLTATSLVENISTEAIHPGLTPPWEQVRDEVKERRGDAAFAAFQFTLDSPRIPLTTVFADYAAPSFGPRRPILECTIDLCHRIFVDFTYDTSATTVTTPVQQAFRTRVGVCQDFAHIMIACLRALGLSARYVSGYLRTRDSTAVARASHAWLAVYCPGFDWLDFDPTNDVMPSTDHITLGWGRDYSDVPPVNGIALGGGAQTITVDVEVKPARTLHS